MLIFGGRTSIDELLDAEYARLSRLASDINRLRRGENPEAVAPDPSPLLNYWILGRRPVPCLVGLSTGHPRLPGENRPIGTSDLWLISEDRSWARTLSRWYRLGRPAGHDDLHS